MSPLQPQSVGEITSHPHRGRSHNKTYKRNKTLIINDEEENTDEAESGKTHRECARAIRRRLRAFPTNVRAAHWSYLFPTSINVIAAIICIFLHTSGRRRHRYLHIGVCVFPSFIPVGRRRRLPLCVQPTFFREILARFCHSSSSSPSAINGLSEPIMVTTRI